MNLRRALICGAALVALAAPGAFARTAGAASNGQAVHQRKVNQQRRIANGARTGKLTPKESAKLEHQQRSINREERHMRKADNGHLTKADRRALNRRQNRASRKIYAKKHNAKRGY